MLKNEDGKTFAEASFMIEGRTMSGPQAVQMLRLFAVAIERLEKQVAA